MRIISTLQGCLIMMAVACSATPLSAQPDPIQCAMFDRYLSIGLLVNGGQVQPRWRQDGSSFWYVKAAEGERQILKVDPANNEVAPYFDTNRLNAALTEALGYVPATAGVPFENFSELPDGSVQFLVDGHKFKLDLASYALTKLPPDDAFEDYLGLSQRRLMTPGTFTRRMYLYENKAAQEVLSPDRKWFAAIKNDNVWLRSTADGKWLQMTNDGSSEHFWDIESGRFPFGKTRAYTVNPWSPDGSRLVATRIHQPDTTPKEWTNYLNDPVAAGGFPKVSAYILNTMDARVVTLDLGDTTDQYLSVLGWHPDGSAVYLVRLNREFNRIDILAANAATGAVKVILTEQSPTFVRNQHEFFYPGNVGITFLPDGSGFVWESERDGWNHLYLYDISGKLMRRLTSGNYPVIDVQLIDQDAGFIYFTANGEARPYDTHLYRVPLSGGKSVRLTEGEGQHRVVFSPSRQYFIDTYSSVATPPRAELRRADGGKIRTLEEADISALKQTGWTPPEEFVVKAADGATDLWGVMYKPHDFDPQKKYPVLEFIYAGPQIAFVNRDFATSTSKSANLPQAMAQLGYIVVMVDGRGTPERSKAFHDVIHKNWGRFEIADHAGAIRQLGARHAFMDMNRVGITGHSWGGYYATRALIDAPDVYKAAIAGSPAFGGSAFGRKNMLMMNEPYMGLAWDNREVYDYSDLTRQANRIRSPYMIIIGTEEGLYLTSMRMVHALIQAGVNHEFVVLPGQHHGYVGAGQTYAIEKIVRFFDQHLQP